MHKLVLYFRFIHRLSLTPLIQVAPCSAFKIDLTRSLVLGGEDQSIHFLLSKKVVKMTGALIRRGLGFFPFLKRGNKLLSKT